MRGLPASNTTNVFVSVHSGDLVAGLIGGAIVLAGVFLTEMLVRHRERRRRLDAAAWEIQSTTRGLLGGRPQDMSEAEASARLFAFLQQLGRIRTDARWPIRRAKEIRRELDAIALRLVLAVGREGAGKAGPPRLGPILGDKLFRLVIGPKEATLSKSTMNDALRAEGLPTIAEMTADESLNMPLPGQGD